MAIARSLPRMLITLLLLATVSGCQSQERTRAIYILEESGQNAHERGNYQLAAEEFEEVVERRPGKLSARIQLGRTLLAAGRPDEAMEHLTAAQAIDPNNDEVVELLARAMLGSVDTEQLATFLRDRAEERNTPEHWMRLGRYLNLAGDVDESESAFLEAAMLDGGRHLGPQLALARFYQALGDTENATRRYRMVLYLDREHEEARSYLRSQGRVPGPGLTLEPAERSRTSGDTTGR